MSMYNPAHPGEILKELIIQPLGLTVTQVAAHLDVSRKTLSKVMNGRGAVTPEMALRLEMAFEKPSADHWLRLQSAHDLSLVRQSKDALGIEPIVVAGAA
jgi:addiction module HigA family antidote